jgi:cytochrome c oxidase cbb3-type subunit III
MNVSLIMFAAGALWLLASAGLPAQSQRSANPLEGNTDAARRGALLYRTRCAGCHGLDGRGVSGPDLTAILAAGLSDARFFATARNGVAGTEMPRLVPEQTTDTQIWEILTHLRTLSGGTSEIVQGNAESGARVFQAQCAGCHIVNGKGGRLGPNLSRIGSMRSASALSAKIRNPNRSFTAGYRPVTLVTADNRRVRGLRKNEDAFTIQIMDMTERIQGYAKKDLREIISEQQSPMPVFGTERINDKDMNDLLSYLMKLRGTDSTSAQ